MIGAIIGDIVGSRFEWHNIKTKEFELFTDDCFATDDSIMTIAIAKALLMSDVFFTHLSENTVSCMQELGRKYPGRGYGGSFQDWLYMDNPMPYNSWGNGAPMRVSPCGFFSQRLDDALYSAKTVTEVTHNHIEGIKGAQATAAAIFLARKDATKKEIREYIVDNFYDLDFTLDEIRDSYKFDVSSQGTTPQAIEAFLESTDFEDAIRNAISIGGDSDTLACITGGIAEAFYGVPRDFVNKAYSYLDYELISIIDEFRSRIH